ncbi:hypothetical protein NET03_11185 [Thermomicrobium sp. CFH 73360]|uniref:hypothetical protein n=1 Tax=Thermomicrobium sp. CFH 73360 TaxID=2951987 RepID=UPI00207749BC|nr:hypothetical protein [Thermomicrobium sp. CFH 73360]MCM8747090.1 hypothetical protein [Thermomicrobium sp. CFH 73360]
MTVNLLSGQATLRDARGLSWSGTLAAEPPELRTLVAAGREVVQAEAKDRGALAPWREQAQCGPGCVQRDGNASLGDATKGFLLRVDDGQLLMCLRAMRVTREWQAVIRRSLHASG